MNKQEFIDYILHTPFNSNPQVLKSNLEGVGNEEDRMQLIQKVVELETEPNMAILQYYIDLVFDNFVQEEGKTYTVRINTTDSNPETCCVYLDDAADMTKGSSDWDSMPIFNSIKPCMFKNGKVAYYLNPNDYSKKANGAAAKLDGSDGDVMVEFDKFAYRIYNDGGYTYVTISNDADTIASDTRFKFLPFTRENEGDRSKIYIGAYHGVVVNGKLRSISDSAPTVNMTIGNFRNAAQANGAGYEQFTFYQMTMLQCLYLIRYGNLNSQAALGAGRVSAPGPAVTGGTNTAGMYYGDVDDQTAQVKFAGVEDFYGSVADFIDGAYCDNDCHALVATNNFNDEVTGYKDLGAISSGGSNGWMSSIWGNTELGFIPKEFEGSNSTYFSDQAGVHLGCFAYFGTFFDGESYGGAFFLGLSAPADYFVQFVGARLSYY